MHSRRPAYPAMRQRLAARSLDPPWHASGWGRGGSDPPRRRLGTGSGRGGNSHLVPALLGSLPHQQSLAGRPSERRFGTRRINPVLLRLPPLPKLPAPLSCQSPPACSLAPGHPHGGLGPDTATRVAPTQRPPSGFHRPSKGIAGSRRPSDLPRVGMPPPCVPSGLPAKDCWTRSDPPRRLGWNAHPNLRRCHDRHRKRWVATVTASVSRAASPPRRPWRKRKLDNDLRSRRPARPNGDSAHIGSVAHVRLHPGTDPSIPGLGSTSRVDSEHRLENSTSIVARDAKTGKTDWLMA